MNARNPTGKTLFHIFMFLPTVTDIHIENKMFGLPSSVGHLRGVLAPVLSEAQHEGTRVSALHACLRPALKYHGSNPSSAPTPSLNPFSFLHFPNSLVTCQH